MKIKYLILSAAYTCFSPSRLVYGRNIVSTDDGIAIANTNESGLRRALVAYDANRSQENVHQFSNLPTEIRGFDDVAIDSDALAEEDDAAIFAIDARSGLVCSFNLSASSGTLSSLRGGGVSLQLIGCTTQRVRASPYVGISAERGTLVVSGGTGGVSVFRYDTSTGRLDTSPTILNRRLNVIGNPSVTMVSQNIAAMCSDVSGNPGFGVTIANINQSTRSLVRARFFPIHNTVGFLYALSPANFPCESSVYNQNRRNGNERSYLYAANGPVTVQNPRRNGTPTVVNVPNGFDALTVDVNSEHSIAVFGGVIRNSAESALLILDISNDPFNPTVVSMGIVRGEGGGRITSVATDGRNVFYVFDDGSSTIGHRSIQQSLLEDS